MTQENYQPQEGYVIPTNGIEVIKDGGDIIVRYDIEAVEAVDNEVELPQQYVANNVRIKAGADYGQIVSAIVEDKYNEAEMQAVINNYLVSPEEGDHTEAFNAMQNWRRHAKEVAKKVLAV